MIVDQKLSIKLPVCLKLIYDFSTSLMKITAGVLVELYKLILKVM